MVGSCPNCGLITAVNEQIGGRLVCAAAGAAFGAKALNNPVAAIFLTIGGFMAGLYMDQQISKRCPQCGAILRITGLLP